MSKDSSLADATDTPNQAENQNIKEAESSLESANNTQDETQDNLNETSKDCTQESSQNELDENELDSSKSSEKEGENPSGFQAQVNEWKDKYLRAHADFENVKKRLEREKNQALEYAYEKIAKDLLPIVDTLERAKEAAKEHNAILEGINLTQENLLKALQKHGIEEIGTSGEFDPNLHECIMQVQNAELNDGDIAQVLQKGYTYKERTLRPAMVALVKN
ncbi:nucleotide exchange factor GrpE [Helicobacter sp. T3_23-1059]